MIEADCFSVMGDKFEFIAMEKPSLMKARKHWSNNGECYSQLGLLDVHRIDIDILKRHNIWDKIDPKIQKEIENLTVEEQAEVHDHMENMRAKRKSRFANVPKELVCSCGKKMAIQPSVLVAKVEKMKESKGITYTVEEFVKAWACQTCKPVKRGRKASLEFVGLPKKMKCSCGRTVATNPYQLKTKAAKLGTTILELIKGFKCQTCSPSPRGRPKKK